MRLNSSRVAVALERANAAQISVEGERRATLQAVSSAYAQAISARSTLEAGQEAVRAATVAAEGVRQEAQVGLRTTLDVLNQELELRSAQVTLASARRNEYVAQANLLASMGRLEGQDLDAAIPVYDPAANYNRVRNRGGLRAVEQEPRLRRVAERLEVQELLEVAVLEDPDEGPERRHDRERVHGQGLERQHERPQEEQ